MKTYWCLIISLLVFTSQRTVFSQNLYSPYPIIFVHGLNSNDLTWSILLDHMKNNYDMKYGGRMDFCLNQDGNTATSLISNDYKDYTYSDKLHQLTKGDLYTINFDVDNIGIPYNNLIESNQSAIVKQGKAISDAIKHVLTITGKEKVILVGHSMGGLAIREYLQRTENNLKKWWENPTDYLNGHCVAKVVTIGTPHGGSNITDLPNWVMELLTGVKGTSEAVRDLRITTGSIQSQKAVYLYGGLETTDYYSISSEPCNYDFNCNGLLIDTIVGLNNFVTNDLPVDIGFCWIVSDYIPPYPIIKMYDDGVVSINNQFINYNDTIMTNKLHTNEPSDYYSIIRGLDEPNKISLAYELKLNYNTKGFVTYQANNKTLDKDVYKINILKSGFLTLNVLDYFEAGVDSIELLDNNYNILSNVEYPYIFNGISRFITAGRYYINVYGTAKQNSYLNPYTINTKFHESQSPNESIVEIEYFLDSDPGIGKGTTLQVTSSNNISENYRISLDNISNGFHSLFVRAKDVKSKWSFTHNFPFYKYDFKSKQISDLEYFIDSDPGLGNATKIYMTKATISSKSFNVPLTGISNGFHTLYLRVKDDDGRWSINSTNAFYCLPTRLDNITEIEYFFDMDPGIGYGTSIAVSPKTSDVTKLFNVELACLSAGNHTFYVRAKNDLGNWSMVYSKNTSVSLVSPLITQNSNILHSNAISGNQWYNQNGLIIGATNQDYLITTNGEYYVIVTHAGCSSVKSNKINVINTEFDNVDIINSIKVYPNPVTEYIQVTGFSGVANLKITDISGREIISKQVYENETILMHSIPKGVYIIKLITLNGVTDKTIIKK